MSNSGEQERLELLDGPFLPLFHFGNERRFVDLFRSTWNRIPEHERRFVQEFWELSQREPYCELSNLWMTESRSNYAQVTGLGCELRFLASAFLVLPDEVARFVIAHELAHVFQKAEGKSPGGACEEENEAEANSIAERWGFDRIGFLTFQMLVEYDGLEAACRKVQLI